VADQLQLYLAGGDFSSAGYEINSAGGPVNLVSYGQNHFRTAGPLAYTPGKTIAVVIDRDANPSEIWIAPDITDTSGCGGGPVWNGDTTTYAAPVRFTSGAHSPCGGPGTGSGLYGPPDTGQTGMAFFTPFGSAPAMIGQNYNAPATNVTFNFDASATLDAIIGSGGPGPIYRPWNTSGGAPSVPGPLNPMIQNVANAPAWQQNTAYTSFPNDDRVLAGSAYNPGTGLFTNGQPLYLWAVASGGGGTSGNNSTYAGHFGTAPCPVPANAGGTVAPGGYNDSSGIAAWNAATHVTDGGVTWVCLTSVDYNTFTGALEDDPVSWAPSTGYYVNQFIVTAAGNAYMQIAHPATYPNAVACTSGLTAPSGTVFGGGSSDGSRSWVYEGTVGYTSRMNVLGHQINSYWANSGAIANVPQHNWLTYTRLWWGGDAKQIYQDKSAARPSRFLRRSM
jgi:hypothetical protein